MIVLNSPSSEIDTTKPETVHSSPQFKGKLYGIELEIEADGLYGVEEVFNEESDEYTTVDPSIPEGWLREQEDSILGVELISRQPFDFDTSVENINRVFADIERQNFIPTRTPRGSTHVHANVSDLTWEQMKYFVLACAWAEPTLIELAGKGRKGNLFAQSYESTPIGWAPVIRWCRAQMMNQIVDTHYMAVSFHPMSYLGSVEFRMGPSSRTAEEAIRWLKCIDTVVTAGRETVVGLEEPPFLSVLLSKFDKKKQKQLRAKGLKQATEVYYAINEPYTPPVPRSKKFSELAMQNALDSVSQSLAAACSSQNVFEGMYPSSAPPVQDVTITYDDETGEFYESPIVCAPAPAPPLSSYTPNPPPIEDSYFNYLPSSATSQPWMEGCNCPVCLAVKAEYLSNASTNSSENI